MMSKTIKSYSKWLMVMAVALTSLLSGCSANTLRDYITLTSATEGSEDYAAIYIKAGGAEPSSIQSHELDEEQQISVAKELGITIISPEELEERIDAIDDAAIIYIERTALPLLSEAQLQQWYQNHKFIVAINTQTSELADSLNLSTGIDDLQLEYLRDGHIFASSYRSLDDLYNGSSSYYAGTDFYRDFEWLHTVTTYQLSNFLEN